MWHAILGDLFCELCGDSHTINENDIRVFTYILTLIVHSNRFKNDELITEMIMKMRTILIWNYRVNEWQMKDGSRMYFLIYLCVLHGVLCDRLVRLVTVYRLDHAHRAYIMRQDHLFHINELI
eukprot:101107_1